MDRVVIRLLPLDQLDGRPPPIPAAAYASGGDPLAWAPRRRFTPSGRAALDAILRGLELDPADDVLISNTSGQTWVSSCVSSIVFNYCRPSRVLTERTRAIVVIHEYGHPHPALSDLLDMSRARGIPLIEDSAHSLDSSIDGVPLGASGDYAVFSLSKVLPVAAGGVLVGPEAALAAIPDNAAAATDYHTYAPGLSEYSRRRRANFEAVRARFPGLPLLLDSGPGVTPWLVGLCAPGADIVRGRASAIEWGGTLRDDLLLVPTNPFASLEALLAALEDALG